MLLFITIILVLWFAITCVLKAQYNPDCSCKCCAIFTCMEPQGEVECINNKLIMRMDKNGEKCLEERFPSAMFCLGKTVGGVDSREFLTNQYRVITFEEIVDTIDKSPIVTIDDCRVVCIIGVYDPEDCEELKNLLEDNGVISVSIDEYEDKELYDDDVIAIIGNPYTNGRMFEFSLCPKIFWAQDVKKLIDEYEDPEVSKKEYSEFLMANAFLFGDYAKYSLDEIDKQLDSWIN